MFGPMMIGSAAVALAATTLSPSAAAGGGTPPPGKVVIDVALVNGSGCPRGTAMVAVAPDNTGFVLSTRSFPAQAGAGSQPGDSRSNCQVGLRVNVPQGFTYAIAGAEYSGYAHLEKGATGLVRARQYFQGGSQTADWSQGFAGPYDGPWQASEVIRDEALVYAPCGEQRDLVLNTELRVHEGTSNPSTTRSYLVMGAGDGTTDTPYRLAWKTCPGHGSAQDTTSFARK